MSVKSDKSTTFSEFEKEYNPIQMQQSTNHLKGVSLNKASELSGENFETTKSFSKYNNPIELLKGVSLKKASELSGANFETTKKELVLDMEKDETGEVLSFLLHQNDMNKQVGKKELEEALEKDAEKIVEQELEEFSNYQSVELDKISSFYFGSLSVIMLFYIYRSLKR